MTQYTYKILNAMTKETLIVVVEELIIDLEKAKESSASLSRLDPRRCTRCNLDTMVIKEKLADYDTEFKYCANCGREGEE